jgi:hypothetical protein
MQHPVFLLRYREGPLYAKYPDTFSWEMEMTTVWVVALILCGMCIGILCVCTGFFMGMAKVRLAKGLGFVEVGRSGGEDCLSKGVEEPEGDLFEDQLPRPGMMWERVKEERIDTIKRK